MASITPELSPAQQEAVSFATEPLLITGVAGTGKTTVIQERFLRLVESGVRPERIAVVTPAGGRADALRSRLEGRLVHGYEQLFVMTPVELAALLVGPGGAELDVLDSVLRPGERFAMLLERIDELSLQRHDFAGSANALLTGFVRRIDRLKAHLVGAEAFARWAESPDPGGAEPADAALEREFAEVYRAHERMLAQAGVTDAGNLIRDALEVAERGAAASRRFEHLLLDDADVLDPAAAALIRSLGAAKLTAGCDPARGGFGLAAQRTVVLERSSRCPDRLLLAACACLDAPDITVLAARGSGIPGEAGFWRCANDRAQAQSVAADIERLTAREGVQAGDIVVLVPSASREGQAIAVALEERAVPHRVVGAAAFFQRAEIRDLLAWLRLLADPSDAAAVVRALARPPIDLRSVDIARCTQIARRRKLDMVGALAAATESPQVPPEARERIRIFLKLYRAGASGLDTTRPDLHVHRLIDRLGLRRHQLFAAQTDVVERLRALARFGELASSYGRRSPQATAREFARSIAGVADSGLREEDEPQFGEVGAVQVMAIEAAGGLEADHVYVVGLHSGLAPQGPDRIQAPLLPEGVPATGEVRSLGRDLYLALSRARRRAILSYPSVNDRGAALLPAPPVERARAELAASWEDKQEELFGPAETLHSTYRLLRDELLEGTMRAGGRLGELRFDTDLDVSHAVVRYLELLKLAALIARPEGQGLAEAIRDVNARILQAVTAEQREILTSSALDDFLLDAERDVRRRSQAIAARNEPSLEPFLPKRGEGVVLSASDIDTYRTCPLKYKFARVFRIPQEPTIHQRFGILVHQVLERFHGDDSRGSLAELLGLLDARWRRAGFGDSEEERQLRGKAAAALERYHERFQSEEAQPMWFERPFTFRLGPHLLRGRVDRVDRLPGGEYELIDYKTGRPKSSAQLAEDVQLSLYAVGARESWSLEASRQAYYYVLDDEKVSVDDDDGDRADWIREVAHEVADGILSQGFEPTPSYIACSVCDYRLMCPAAER
ncbi:MAG: ATP-dependent helicase [Solirubrobacterales bacterium]|nr:ATP-dependent helicase [Solirubrobacterales bacterium]